MAQQTAVEWLAEQLPIRIVNSFQEEIAKAKQMEKEQIIKAASVVLWNNSSNSTKAAEQYYNETYKN